MEMTTTFDTELGRCAVRWTEAGITSVLLPTRDARPTPPVPRSVPDVVRRAIDGMTAVLAGAADDLRDVPLDDRAVDPFRRQVYAATRAIPPGSTRSYGEIAQAIGRIGPEAAREVGAALARNPTPIIVPCHRVVAADG